jgi:hypothetical protein
MHNKPFITKYFPFFSFLTASEFEAIQTGAVLALPPPPA